jgi:hypothetical protein
VLIHIDTPTDNREYAQATDAALVAWEMEAEAGAYAWAEAMAALADADDGEYLQ